jgi:iron(III) transport system permease protein
MSITISARVAPNAPTFTADKLLSVATIAIPAIGLLLFFIIPLATMVKLSFVDDSGQFGIANYLALLNTPGIVQATQNSLLLGASTTAICLILGFVLAYAIERSGIIGKGFVSTVLYLPVLAPSLVLGLGLIFLLGRNGLIGKFLGIHVEIYGFPGLLLANALYALPQAVIILRAALRQTDARYYDAASVMGASAWHQFWDITVPGTKFGLLSAGFVVFTLTITDFGNAVVIGGDTKLLAIEIYNQVSGQMKFGVGAAVGMLLLLPTGLSLYIERVASKRQSGGQADGAVPPTPVYRATRDIPLFAVVMAASLSIALVVATVVYASFVNLWPYRLDLGFKHYSITISGGYTPLWTSLGVSLGAAIGGTILLFALALGLRRAPPFLAKTIHLIAVMPVGVPGLVLGLAYVFAFNQAGSPLEVLYGTALLIAICNFYHYHSQGFLTTVTGLRAVPAAVESAAACLGGSATRVLLDVIVPIMGPTLLSVFFFLFMRSMVTLSAVIFLVSPSLSLASVSVMRLDEAGFVSQAAAFSTCIMLVVAASAWVMRRAVALASVRMS